MTKPLISVVLCARERVSMLHTMLGSLFSTAGNPHDIEVVIRCDADDAPMLDYLRNATISGWPMFMAQSLFIVGTRGGYASISRMTNDAVRASTADLILVVNDDVVFRTYNWDRLLLDEAAKYQDGMFVFGVDVENAENFVFPCVSRRVVNALGCLFDERLLYPDIWLRDVLRAYGDRAVRVPHVALHHDWHGLSDDQRKAIDERGQAHDQIYGQAVREGVEKLRAAS